MSETSVQEKLLGKTLDEIIGDSSDGKPPQRSRAQGRQTQGVAGEEVQAEPQSVYAGFARKASAGKEARARPAAAEPAAVPQERESAVDLPLEVYGAQRRRGRTAAGKRAQPFPADGRPSNATSRSSNMIQGLNGATLVGRVKSFSEATSWGFVRSDRIRSRDIFFHINDCDSDMGPPWVGAEVEFELEHTDAGDPRAANVRLAVPESTAAQPRGQLALANAPRARRERSAHGARVRVGNFVWTLTRFELREAFEACGEVLRVEMDETRVGQAIIEFKSASSAQRAVREYDKGLLNGRQIFVRFD